MNSSTIWISVKGEINSRW